MYQKLGQHFLVNPAVLARIAAALELSAGEVVIEIGPGHGELTRALFEAQHKIRVYAIERDKDLIVEFQMPPYASPKTFSIVEGDALKELPELVLRLGLKDSEYKIAGNIPYYITGRLFRTLAELPIKPSLAVFTIQREVAERMTAIPPKMNLLAASLQVWSECKILSHIPKRDFRPAPDVESSVISISSKKGVRMDPHHPYYAFIRTLFKQPRKTILNNLSVGRPKGEAARTGLLAMLKKAGINPAQRPQNLDITSIRALSEMFYTE